MPEATTAAQEVPMRHLPDLLRRHSLSVGVVLMFALTWPLDLAVAAEARGWLPFDFPNGIELLVGYGFVLAAILMTALTLGRAGVSALLRRYLIWRAGPSWYGVVLFGPFAVDLAAVWLYAALRGSVPGVGPVLAHRLFGPSANLALYVLPFFLFDAVTNGEEIGWRGYLLPRLQARHSALLASLITGVIWALWHVPKFLVPGNAVPFGAYLLETIAKAILFTWVYNNTRGSLLLATLFHAAINTAGVFLLPPLATDPGPFILAAVIELAIPAAVVLLAAMWRSPATVADPQLPIRGPVQGRS